MAGYETTTGNLVQFLRDVEDLRSLRKLSPAFVLRTLKAVPRFRADLKALPKVSVAAGDDDKGRAFKAFLAERTLRLQTRHAAAVLPLPETPSDYLKGRYRERVRANIARANGFGLTCEAVNAHSFIEVVEACARKGSAIKYLGDLMAETVTPPMEHWIGFDQQGEPIAFVRLQTVGDIAWLKCLTAIHDDPRSVIRYKISAEIFMHLAERKFAMMIAGSAVGLPDGLLFFQHLLGFRAVRIEVETPVQSTEAQGFPVQPGKGAMLDAVQ